MNEKEKMRETLSDLKFVISWREIANKYFDKSASWIYHKLDGIDSNGGFTEAEAKQLHEALYDLSNRLGVAADKINF